jgi:hypothetical protein
MSGFTSVSEVGSANLRAYSLLKVVDWNPFWKANSMLNPTRLSLLLYSS